MSFRSRSVYFSEFWSLTPALRAFPGGPGHWDHRLQAAPRARHAVSPQPCREVARANRSDENSSKHLQASGILIVRAATGAEQKGKRAQTLWYTPADTIGDLHLEFCALPGRWLERIARKQTPAGRWDPYCATPGAEQGKVPT